MPVGPGINLGKRSAAVRIEPRHRSLRFEFAALSFAAPENVVFRYRLEPFDGHWIEAGSQRTATYPRLTHGTYRFRVTACNSAGIWNEEGAVFAFSVVPFPWQTWWFRITAVLACLGTTAGLVRYMSFRRLRRFVQKLEQQAALDRERARIARDIHDDLGGRLTEVELLIAMAQRAAPEQSNGTMGRMAVAVRQAGESLDEIVWAVNPKHDSLPLLVNYLGQYAIQFLNAAGIRCRVDLPERPAPDPVPPEVRHNLFLAVKEALNNVARHAQATEAWLRVSLSPGWFQVRVEDNGRGLRDGPMDPGSDGLGNMRQRMEAIGGRFDVQSMPQGGTTIILTLIWPPQYAHSDRHENGLS
jgi:signal transduction histidine kinase